jgi:hypothetical protein
MKVISRLPLAGGPVSCGPGDRLYVYINGERVIQADIEESQVFDTAVVVDDLPYENLKETRGYFLGENSK